MERTGSIWRPGYSAFARKILYNLVSPTSSRLRISAILPPGYKGPSADVYDGIVSYLRDMAWVATGDPNILFRIVAELVRSKTFATGRYLQWLIATGSTGHSTDLSSPHSWPLRLVTEIPLSGLTDQIRTLRNTLLRGTMH